MDNPSRRNIILAIPAIVAFRSIMRVKIVSGLIEPVGEVLTSISHDYGNGPFASIIEHCRLKQGFHESMLDRFIMHRSLENGTRSVHLDLVSLYERMAERAKIIGAR